MAPKDPVSTPAFPGAEAHPAPVKDVVNSPIIPIVPEPVKDAPKAGVDVKKGKTEVKKKASSTAKVDLPDAAMEVKVAEVPSMVPVEAKVEVPSVAKEVHVPIVTKEVHILSVAKVEVKVPGTPPVIAPISSLKSAEVSGPPIQPTCVDEDEVVIVMETISKKFGEITFSDYNSAEDGDFSLSEAETEDSLEWASETERTRAEDDLAEDKVGINYVGAALDIATEQAASFRIVQAGLAIGDWVLGTVESMTTSEVAPMLSSARRSARKIRRAGERVTGPFRPLGIVSESTMTMASAFLSTPLALLGWQFRPATQAKAKKVWMEGELCEEPCTFEELDLSDYESDLDADYLPSDESSEDDLEFCTDAEESSGSEESDSV